MGGWIKIEEKQPNENQLCLTWCHGYYEESFYVLEAYIRTYPAIGDLPEIYCWENSGQYVTHWMPLPDPPENNAG